MEIVYRVNYDGQTSYNTCMVGGDYMLDCIYVKRDNALTVLRAANSLGCFGSRIEDAQNNEGELSDGSGTIGES